jgi:DNA polymerase-3 subunit alpha
LFLNPDRVSLPDIDVDFPPNRRQEVIDFIATIDGVDFSEIITFNTFALKGAIREVGRFLDMSLQEVDMISKSVEKYNGKDHIDESYKKRYPELFKYVDLMVGVIFAMGSHPSGFVVSPVNLDETVSTLYTKDSKYKVSAVDMGELDSKNFVKLDVLGLMNIELINETCKIANIERLTPDNVDINDINVWKSMSESTLGVFQMESDSAQRYVKQLFSQETLDNIHKMNPNASYIDLLSMANGAIRPSGNSYRYELSQGIMKDNGHDALNDFLKPTLGFLIFQEQIMKFLTKFANHTGSESDTVRRGLSKKKGTQQYLDKIRQGFSEFMKSEYNEKQETIDEIIEPFLKIISDASGYGFSDNHSKPYSYTGYIGAYLRYHYPLEFLTTALNLQDDDKEQTGKIINYAKSKKITIKPVEFGKSGASYRYNKDENAIYKGIASIKYLNSNVAKELLDLEKTTSYNQNEFHLLVRDLIEKTSLNTRQAEILIRLDFFKRFGKKEILLEIYLTMTDKKKPNTLKYENFKDVVQKNVKINKRTGEEKLVLKTIKKPVAYKNNLVDKTKEKRLKNAKEYEEAVRNNPPTKIELYEQIQFEKDNLGYAVSTFPELPDNVALVTEVNKKFTPLVTFYILNNGDEKLLKVKKKDFWSDDIDKLFVGDVVQIKNEFEEAGWRHLDGKFVRDENKIDKFLGNCRIIRPSKKRKP